MKKLNIKVIKPDDGLGLYHDSRRDAIKTRQIFNILIDKINELVKEVNELKNSK